MDELRFRHIVEANLIPMLQATLVTETTVSTAREGLASYDRPTRLLVKPSRDAGYRVPVERSQAFTPLEHQLVAQFIKELAAVVAMESGKYEDDLINAIPRRVIAVHLGGGSVLQSALERLEQWSSQTYEGQRIVVSLGISDAVAGSGISLDELWDQPFGPVLTNGFDTMVVVGSDGDIGGFQQLAALTRSNTVPYRLSAVGCWSEGSKITVVLNRNGEILVFQDRSLRFARRNGQWVHYSHETNILRMSPPRDRPLREAIYESCLDVSFSRTGGCLGVIGSSHAGQLEAIVAQSDMLGRSRGYKARLLSRAIGRLSFPSLDRRLRLELLSLDGAVILNHVGGVLAAGAIIEVPAGSAGGGGRTAAARKLSNVGLGIKISQDGSVTGFRDDKLIFRA